MTKQETKQEQTPPLRRGWTTGTCAAVAAAAAYEGLLSGHVPDMVDVALPRGGTATLVVADSVIGDGIASATVIKDAGDDPDVTNGARIVATVRKGPQGAGVRFFAGEGVGLVTQPGLPVGVGEPAITPGPRGMITQALRTVAEALDTTADVDVTVSVPGGEALAEKTLNGRLGIVGGISILGTTGVVVPFSCASWLHSIHRGIDVARAAGLTHLAAATGSTSEARIRDHYQLPEPALIDMGDFVGGTLKYLRTHPVPWLTLAGGFAKMVKLAQGHLYLHSSKSRVDMDRLSQRIAELGASPALTRAVAEHSTAAPVPSLAEAEHLPIGRAIAEDARAVAQHTLGTAVRLDVVVFERSGRYLGHAGPDG